jgi:hypothetical protein
MERLDEVQPSVVPNATKVFLNGRWVGIHREPNSLVATLRHLRRQVGGPGRAGSAGRREGGQPAAGAVSCPAAGARRTPGNHRPGAAWVPSP